MEPKHYENRPGRRINPLGGREAVGFGDLIEITYRAARETADTAVPGDPSGPARLAREAAEHYRKIKYMLSRAQQNVTPHSRDHLETELIGDVMMAYGLAETARQGAAARVQSSDPAEWVYAQVGAQYLRACTILAQYLGVRMTDVAGCGDDQNALSALRA